MLEQASRQAETAMNRPKWASLTHHMYKTPEENAKARTGSAISKFTKKMMGQETPTHYSKKTDSYVYPSDDNPGMFDKLRKHVDSIPQKFGFKVR
jgi:hypothetical protein